MSSSLDEIDRAILHALQEDARNNTNAAISERVSVSASTVGKRIARLEKRGIITAHRTEIEYEEAGFPLCVLFLCTAKIVDREALAERALELPGVVTVRELMTGRENVHIQAVGASNDDITRIAHALDEMGFTVADEILMRAERSRPLADFAEARDED